MALIALLSPWIRARQTEFVSSMGLCQAHLTVLARERNRSQGADRGAGGRARREAMRIITGFRHEEVGMSERGRTAYMRISETPCT